MQNIPELHIAIQSLLVELFKTFFDMANAILRVSEGVLMDVNKDWKTYKYGTVLGLVSIANQSLSNFVSFFEAYFKGITTGFDLVYELLKVLGVENFYDVVQRRVNLRSVVKPKEINLGFLKFQLKTVLDYIAPRLEEHMNLIYQKSENPSDDVKFIESEIVQNFKTSIKNYGVHWRNFKKKLYSNSELIFKEEDPSNCANLIIQIVESAIEPITIAWQMTEFIPLFAEDLKDYSIYEITETAEKFSKLKGDIEILTKCREKIYEHEINCFMVILRMLWDSDEIATEKMVKIIRTPLPEESRAEGVKEIIPQKISLEDLSFALLLARGEFDLSKSAEKRVKEKIESLRLAAELIKSPIIQLLYETTIKRLAVKDKYDEKILEILLKLQEIATKENKNKT